MQTLYQEELAEKDRQGRLTQAQAVSALMAPGPVAGVNANSDRGMTSRSVCLGPRSPATSARLRQGANQQKLMAKMLMWSAWSVALTSQNTVEKPLLPVVLRTSRVGHLLSSASA